MAEPADRWSAYTDLSPTVASGWRLDVVTPPSRLGGSNGMTIGPDGRLYVTQVFFSQITAIDVETGVHDVFSPLGSGISGPDDAIFGADGTCFATEPMYGRVTARQPDGAYRVVAADLPAANGCTMDHARQRLFIDEFRPGGRLLEVDPNGAGPPRILLEDLDGPNAPAMGPDGKLYFPQVFANQVWSYDLETGEARLAVDDLARPTAVKFDSRGRLVTSEAAGGRITAIDLATGAREVLADVPLGIDNVSVGADDRIFVSHYVDGRVAEETAGRQRVLSAPGLLGPHGLAVDADGLLLFADGLSVGEVLDGEHHRRIRLLVDLPTLALGVVPFGDGLAVIGAAGEVLRYGRAGGEPTVLAEGLVDPTTVRVVDDRLLVAERSAGRISAVDRDGRVSPVARGPVRCGVGRRARRRLRDQCRRRSAADRCRRQRTARRGLRRCPGRRRRRRHGAGRRRRTPRAGGRRRGGWPPRRRRHRCPGGSPGAGHGARGVQPADRRRHRRFLRRVATATARSAA